MADWTEQQIAEVLSFIRDFRSKGNPFKVENPGTPTAPPPDPDFVRIWGLRSGPEGRNFPINSRDDLAWETAGEQFRGIRDMTVLEKTQANLVSRYFDSVFAAEIIQFGGNDYVVFPLQDPNFGTPRVYKMVLRQFLSMHPRDVARRIQGLV